MADSAIVGCFFLGVALLLFRGGPIIRFDGAKSYYNKYDDDNDDDEDYEDDENEDDIDEKSCQ